MSFNKTQEEILIRICELIKMKNLRILLIAWMIIFFAHPSEAQMNEMWGNQSVKNTLLGSNQEQLFKDGNYAMFIHWGLYSKIANRWKDKTYYGIGEWIMSNFMAGIPLEEYMATAKTFNPVNFNAKVIAQLAKDAGMKYIIITAKHHDGFAMYHSKTNPFNIVDATPFQRDPMKELSQACKELGLGFGFYYSQNQDWTYPGGNRGPKVDEKGNEKSFDDYFNEKCVPQVKELLKDYGEIQLIWFDTPDGMPRQYAEKLVELVHNNQKGTLVSGRVGHDLGDYKTFGDMEIPVINVEGLWEGADVTNDSWGFAWYDENWKTPMQILCNTLSTIARGGTYMLNVGPDGLGVIPEQAAISLRSAGNWIKKYPQVVYGAEASPWRHALPWGDVVKKNNKLFLLVYNWPNSGKLFLPGLKTNIRLAEIINGSKKRKLAYKKQEGMICFDVPYQAPEELVSVIELTVDQKVLVDTMLAVDPETYTYLLADFAKVKSCVKIKKSWMEKYGEWKHIEQINSWENGGKATWEINVLEPGYYQVELKYSGEGRIVWKVETGEGKSIQNEQNSSPIYTTHPIGWVNFSKPGKQTISVSLVDSDYKKSSLASLKISPIKF